MRGAGRWLSAALLVWAVTGALHLAGLRDWVSVLSGTPVPGVDLGLAALGGGAYVVGWLASVLVAPVFLLTAALSLLSAPGGAQKVSEARIPPGSGVKPSSTPSPRSA